jgi:hypothetical protein
MSAGHLFTVATGFARAYSEKVTTRFDEVFIGSPVQ